MSETKASRINLLKQTKSFKTVDLADSEANLILIENDFYHKLFEQMSLISGSRFGDSVLGTSIAHSLAKRVSKTLPREDAFNYYRESNLESQMISVVKQAHDLVEGILSESLKIVKNKHHEEHKKIKAIEYVQTIKAREEYPNLYNFSTEFVNKILKEASRREENFNAIGIRRFKSYRNPEEFGVKDGIDIVSKVLLQWSYNPNWFYKVIYNGRMITETHTYFYLVRWSVPTPSYPVAQVTVDVHFIVDIIPMKPPPIFIKVWFRIETNRSQHDALATKFSEKWIQDVIRHKLQYFQLFKF